ncbi:MAG: rtcA [Deltaproteobacteria bacterium]|nr:rtcA [Deltaproteobacteria bacterium]
MADMVHIDGSAGEGGGQILRTSLTLSIITQKPLHLVNIRPRRGRPAIQKQHLAAIHAAQKICSATVQGARIGSSEIHFIPGKAVGGTYEFSIGSAGSATLVLQTILFPLMLARHSSNVAIEGGTHNIWAPPVNFLDRVFLSLVRRMGPSVKVDLIKYGFHPAGGGLVHAAIDPVAVLKRIDVNERGKVNRIKATALIAHLPESIGHREIKVVQAELGNDIETSVETVDSRGPGNVLLIEIICDHITEIITSFGRRGLPAEMVAGKAAADARDYIGAGPPVGMHLADQLALPLSLAGGGSFTTMALTEHMKTNIDVIRKFLAVNICVRQINESAWRVAIKE